MPEAIVGLTEPIVPQSVVPETSVPQIPLKPASNRYPLSEAVSKDKPNEYPLPDPRARSKNPFASSEEIDIDKEKPSGPSIAIRPTTSLVEQTIEPQEFREAGIVRKLFSRVLGKSDST